MTATTTSPAPAPRGRHPGRSVSGVQLAQGIGAQAAKSFWADAWSRVLERRAAVAALCWLGVVTFFAVFAPFLSSGHPVRARVLATDQTFSPWWQQMKGSDLLLAAGVPIALGWVFLAGRQGRARRFGAAIVGGLLGAAVVVVSSLAETLSSGRDVSGLARLIRDAPSAGMIVPAAIGVVVAAAGMALPIITPLGRRAAVTAVACAVAAAAAAGGWDRPLPVFNYVQREAAGEIEAAYTLVPFSPSQRFTELDRRPPGTELAGGLGLPADSPVAGRMFLLGTDALGQDVLAQLLHACRIAISIGLVSTSIATLIGVTMGALMGYFGGWVDLVLFRVVEVFMAVPLLFLLIVAAGVLPPEFRSTYTMMAIIGLFTWTGAARFTRAEFLKLRRQDFVQSAQAVGLPLRSVLFRHMLPNGVTPVLVDASFAIAAAISIEATLSFLGLAPVDQASWGKLLSSATSAEGQFKWWLAVFPGVTIFLTVLSYNLIGEALRDAIDPKLKKARV